jgi:glycosyltransferase involved in cell wall biosynthesis
MVGPQERRVLVVVPAYNEQATVRAVVRHVRAELPDCELVVVDDGSSDGTVAEARDEGAVVLSLPFNLGVGGAMRTGYRYALRNGYDAVVQVDGDGQHDARDLHALLQALESANIVVGSRFTAGSTYRVRGPRRWAMRLLARAVSRVAKTRLTDVTSGFRATDRLAIELFARSYPAEYLGDTVESLLVAARAGLTVRQVPVGMRPRQAGTPSQSTWAATLYLGRALLALGLAMIRSREAIRPFERSPEPIADLDPSDRAERST